MSTGAAFTTTILLVIMAEANGYHLLKEVIKFTRVAGEFQLNGYTVNLPAYSCYEPIIDERNLSWENFDNFNLYTKIGIAAAERVANKTPDANDLLQNIIQNPILISDFTAPIEREDKFLPQKKNWFNFLAKIDHLGEIKVWLKKVVNKNGYLKVFGKEFINNFSALCLQRLKHLRSTCENQVEDQHEEVIMDFKILDVAASNKEHIFLHIYKMRVWVDCVSSDNMGGLSYEYSKHTFKTRAVLVDRMNAGSKAKAVEALKCFLRKVVGPEPDRKSTTTQRPTAPTTIKTTTISATATSTTVNTSTVHIDIQGDCH